jgi:predicted nucleic acid-binding protein
LIALDTSIPVYAASVSDDSGRHHVALQLLDNLGSTRAIIPLPVIGELMNARRKRKFAEAELLQATVGIWFEAFDCIAAELKDYLAAVELSARYDLQGFDALIIAVAACAGAVMMLSKDMHDGLKVAGLRVGNPFVSANQSAIADWLGSAA